MSKYRVEVTQYSNGEVPRTAVTERYTEIVEAEAGEQAVEQLKAAGDPNIDADVELLGEADPSEKVTFSEDWVQREYEDHNPNELAEDSEEQSQ
jgi:hypothetical protein